MSNKSYGPNGYNLVDAVANRPCWARYFMNIAETVSQRGTCPRRQVGAILVNRDEKVIIATGYNGAPRNFPHCDHSLFPGSDIPRGIDKNGNCITAIHAEINALLQAVRNGTTTRGADAFVTTAPCQRCFQLMAQAGIRRVFFTEPCPWFNENDPLWVRSGLIPVLLTGENENDYY